MLTLTLSRRRRSRVTGDQQVPAIPAGCTRSLPTPATEYDRIVERVAQQLGATIIDQQVPAGGAS